MTKHARSAYPKAKCITGLLATAENYVDLVDKRVTVFAVNHFREVHHSIPIPVLNFKQKPECKKVFDDWLTIALAHDQYQIPPTTIPPKLLAKFLMNGDANLINDYRNERPEVKEHVWSQIPEWLQLPENRLVNISVYHEEGMAMYHALKNYPLNDKTGFIIGSQTPWVEVFALLNGAKEITTLEYQRIKINGTDKVRYMHPIDFAKNWKTYKDGFDFAISFSSIEHSGLGRYGDPIDPIGDLREVWKTLCVLKKGGFELLATFRDESPVPVPLTSSHFNLGCDGLKQDLFVLRKL
ncbi:hypothetical protein V3C99_016757 [Haemonchus contortus]